MADKKPSIFKDDFLPTLWDGFLGELGEQFGFNRQPGLSVSEDDKHLFVDAAMPGLKPENIEVTLDRGVLKIKAEKKQEEEHSERKYYKKAVSSYNYTMTLPTQVDETTEPKAEYQDGVMKLTFDKTETTSAKKIKVS